MEYSKSKDILWRASPSQMTNLGSLLFGGAVILASLGLAPINPLFLLAGGFFVLRICWLLLKTGMTSYRLTAGELLVTTGVLSQKTDSLELYRIKDYQITSPFLYRIFGLSNLVLVTSDKTDSILLLKGISQAEAVKSKIRELVETLRVEKRVLEVD